MILPFRASSRSSVEMNTRDQFIIGEQTTKQQDCTINNQQAKQIATIKWLLQKAYDNNVPEHLKEPFYYDKRQQQQNVATTGKNCSIHLKPNIVYSLANAELYCFAMANIYLDPNFHNLNHTGIIQALARKGVMLSDPHLTETVLLQTSPLKLTAHLCVIEAMMILYAKEIATPERIYAAIRKFNTPTQQRFNNDLNSNSVIQRYNVNDYDQLLLLWISEAVSALNKRISQSQETNNVDNIPENQRNRAELFKPPGKELSELCDGISLCALVAFYSPQSLSWKNIRVGKPTNTAECIHNLNLFCNFCQTCLPYQIFHMLPQDVLPHTINYMKPNLFALLADLFNLLEIYPMNGGGSSSAVVDSSELSNNTDRTESDTRASNSSPKADRKARNTNGSDSQNNTEFFVVHKGRNIPTLSTMNSETGVREKHHEPVAAGKPTSWSDTRKSHITGCGGRRSRKNSFSDESQLTIENFGGSHENINLLGRNPDKEPAVHVANLTLSDGLNDNNEARQLRCQVAAQENWSSAGISSLLHDNATASPKTCVNTATVSATTVSTTANDTNAPVSCVTSSSAPSVETAEMLESCKVSSQMLNIRLKLEEKRRQIETEKRRMELNLKRQRQKLNKAAFLQAVSKIENEPTNNNDNVTNTRVGVGIDDGDGNGDGDNSDLDDVDNDSIVTTEDINQVEEKWLKNELMKDVNGDTTFNSDQENIDIEKCQKSISEMDSSLHAIQNDLQWLSFKEKEIYQSPIGGQNQDLSRPYPNASPFMLDLELPQHTVGDMQMQRNMYANNQANQNTDFYPKSNMPFNIADPRTAYGTLPNRMFSNFAYGDGNMAYSPQIFHNSLLATVPSQQSPMSSPRSQMSATFETSSNAVKDYMFKTQQPQPIQIVPPQQQPLLIQTRISPNYNGVNYNGTTDEPNSYARRNVENKENKMTVSPYNEQFYLHKPNNGESTSFHIHSTPVQTVNLASITNATSNVCGQRKTWDTRDTSPNISPQPTPPPRSYTSRYSVSEPLSLSKTFADNKLKSGLGFSKLTNDRNTSASNDTNASFFKRSSSCFSPRDGNERENVRSNHFDISETDATSRRSSAVSLSIPTPSVDDMEPQCISFIGSSQSEESKGTDTSQLNDSLNKLNIINGSRTYRIPSPTIKSHTRPSHSPFSNDDNGSSRKNGRGFYVSLSHDDDDVDDENSKENTPRVIKPPLRTRRINSSNSILSRNEKLKNNLTKKPETTKEPEVLYNEKMQPNKYRPTVQQRLHNETNNSAGSTPDKTIESNFDDAILIKSKKGGSVANTSVGLLITADESNTNDPALVDEMERKKERILLQSLQRRQQQEEMKARKEIEFQRRKEQDKQKEELKAKKKEEEKQRRATILEKHRLKKLIEEAEREGKSVDKELLNAVMASNAASKTPTSAETPSGTLTAKSRMRKTPFGAARPRPKTIHIDVGGNLKENNGPSNLLNSNFAKRGSVVNLTEHNNNNNYGMGRRDYYRGSQDCLVAGPDAINTTGTSASSIYSGSSCDQDSFTYNSRYMTDTDSGLGRATPPHRTNSPAPNNSSSSGPGSLPPSHHSRRLRYDDTASESGGSEYSGLRLYKQPAMKSNRGIIQNAIEYCVFPGEVNRNAKNRILEEISRSDATNTKHFLILFRDARCQFRALYSYFPDTEEVTKVYGTGPKQVTEKMFDKFFKYNSGGKCFSQVHTKHLTVTIDAFTIHNSLWQGKKVNLPNKRDMTLVI